MKTFVSPIYIQTNQYASEKIVFGLLAVDASKIYFKISNDKIDIASKLSDTNIKNLVKTSLELVNNKVNQTNQKLAQQHLSLFDVEHNFNKDYIKYLSKYSSGIVQFNEPKPYDAELTKSSFLKLFEKFVGDKHLEKVIHSKKFANEVKKTLAKPALKEKADVNYSLKPNVFAGLFKNATVSLVTSNGTVSLFQAVDFESSEANIAAKLYEFDAIKDSVTTYASNHLGLKTEASIIAVAPEGQNSPQHKMFDTVYKLKVKSKEVILLSPEQLDKVTTKIINEQHKKLSVLIEEES